MEAVAQTPPETAEGVSTAGALRRFGETFLSVLHNRLELLTLELNHFTGLGDAQAAHRLATAEHGGFAGELARSVRHDEGLRRTGWPQGLHLASDHDEERHAVVPDFDQDLSAGDRSSTPARRDACHLRARQRRKEPFCMRGRRRSQRPLRIGSVQRSPSRVS